ncbi:thrombomodulin-like [Morone saxatilis]|uniref:thrombomodulin-like n=1 Tax=Morone saxatilis TaxID=34816 RepID=UPI0015E1C942|nr:thrombomodulin-like [Morone saxatilis]
MIPTTNALLICVLFLCGLEETVLSQHGHCTGKQCFALFQESKDFPGAQKKCKEFGQLFEFSLEHLVKIFKSLPSGLSGSYWLDLHGTGSTTGLQNCSSISASTERNFTVLSEPCSENLSGFLCQYTIPGTTCSGLQAGGGVQVKYFSHMSFEVKDSETFPEGTTAVAEEPGAKYPHSKHLCYSKQWVPAPWICEVMRGGCEHNCNSTTNTCLCPTGQTLRPNKISCTEDPCAECAQGCQQEGCKCWEGYRLAQDGRSCVDVNECEEENPCTGERTQCENTKGGFECRCKEDFVEEDGVCVDVSICDNCEHMLCDKVNGVYGCVCRKGYKVSARDPTKCERNCTERDCPAKCIQNSDIVQKDLLQCFCPDGYILDVTNTTTICTDINECEIEKPCDHKCENLHGGFTCLCDKGFKLHKGYKCVSTDEEDEEEEEGSGSTPPHPTLAGAHPAAVPSYVKTGSVLGITLFLVLCMALLFFLLQNVVKRCGKFQLHSFKHPNIDIFYLQQVTTETYKRLSFDKPFKNDPQIL